MLNITFENALSRGLKLTRNVVSHELISPKFGAKVHYIDNLSHLARVVPLNQINIPAAVYQ